MTMMIFRCEGRLKRNVVKGEKHEIEGKTLSLSEHRIISTSFCEKLGNRSFLNPGSFHSLPIYYSSAHPSLPTQSQRSNCPCLIMYCTYTHTHTHRHKKPSVRIDALLSPMCCQHSAPRRLQSRRPSRRLVKFSRAAALSRWNRK